MDFDLEGPACEDGTLPAHAVWLPSPHLEDPAPHHVLFIAMRDVSCCDILKAATQELGHVNLISEDLRDMKPFLQVGTDDWSAYVPLNLIHNILQKGDRNTIRLVFVGEDWVLDVRHHFTQWDFENFVIGCQAVEACRYHPPSVFGEDELLAAANRGTGFSVKGGVVRLQESA